MLYTQEEAKRKWCPMARNVYREEISSDTLLSVGHNDKTDQNSYCIGSGCIMWHLFRTSDKGWCGFHN